MRKRRKKRLKGGYLAQRGAGIGGADGKLILLGRDHILMIPRVISEAVKSSRVRIRPGKLEEEHQRRTKSRPTLRNALQTQGHLKVTMYCRGALLSQ